MAGETDEVFDIGIIGRTIVLDISEVTIDNITIE